MCSDTQNKGKLKVVDSCFAYNCEQSSPSSLNRPSLHLHILTVNHATARTDTLSCKNIDTVSKSELFNVFLAVCSPLLEVTAVNIHVQEMLDINRNSNFDAKIFFSNISFVHECHEVASSLAFSTRRNICFTKVQVASRSPTFALEQIQRINKPQRTFTFDFSYYQ